MNCCPVLHLTIRPCLQCMLCISILFCFYLIEYQSSSTELADKELTWSEVDLNTNTTTNDSSGLEKGASATAPQQKYPQFILGYSTGHSGSTTVQASLLNAKGCNRSLTGKFEKVLPIERNGILSEIGAEVRKFDCGFTIDTVLPFLRENARNFALRDGMSDVQQATYVDMGHFHNRGRILECLADQLKEQVMFVRIRRNRYAIAKSFANISITPCVTSLHNDQLTPLSHKKRVHPSIAVCPRSDEGTGPVNLPVSDEVWDDMTPFQRFLWYADEMEHRWHSLKSKYNNGQTYREITWTKPNELEGGISRIVTSDLGCTGVEVHNKKQHLHHVDKSVNCSDLIHQDIEYRGMMGYNADTMEILVSSKFPQRVDMEDCMETRDELERVIERENASTKKGSSESRYNMGTWVLPEGP